MASITRVAADVGDLVATYKHLIGGNFAELLFEEFDYRVLFFSLVLPCVITVSSKREGFPLNH